MALRVKSLRPPSRLTRKSSDKYTVRDATAQKDDDQSEDVLIIGIAVAPPDARYGDLQLSEDAAHQTPGSFSIFEEPD